MRSFALLLLFVNIVFLLWQLTLLPWFPWQPIDFAESKSNTVSPHFPSLVMVNESITSQLIDKKDVSSSSQVLALSLKNDVLDKNIKPHQISKPIQEIKDTFPKEPLSSTKKNPQDVSPLLPQILEQEDVVSKPSRPILQKKDTAPQEDKVKGEIGIQKETPLQQNKQIESEKTTCFHMGPYVSMTEAEKAKHWLKQQQVSIVDVQERKTQMIAGTWIYLPPFDSQKATLKAVQHLSQRGIKHYQIITSGALNNAISLGVYSKQENVDHLLNTLKNIGYKNSQMEKRYKEETTYWLNVKITDKLIFLRKGIEKKFGFSSLIPVNCQ